MSTAASATSDTFEDTIMDLGEPLSTEDKAKIKFSVTHTGIENLRAELANYDEVIRGLDLTYVLNALKP